MRNITNEKKYAEMCLREHHLDKTIIPTLIILIKYWHHEGYDQDGVLNKLDEFMKVAYGDYVQTHWRDKFKDLAKQYCSDNYTLSETDEIYISKNEMDTIVSIKKQELQRVAFSLLVNCKLRNAKRGLTSNRVKDSAKDIFSDAKVRRGDVQKNLMLRELSELGLVEFPKLGLDLILTYIDLETDFSIEDNRYMTIDSFDDFILDYYKYKGAKVIKCKECGKRIMVKGKARTQYCAECAKQKKLEKTLESNKKNRKNQ